MITLTKCEYEHCRELAELRQRDNERKGYRDTAHFSGDPFMVHLLGLLGECVVHILLEKPWNDFTRDTYRRHTGDIGQYEVRTTEHQNGGLLVKRDDPGDRIYIVVRRFSCLEFDVPGWMFGHQAKQNKYWRRDIRYPCYIVPAEDLRSTLELTVPRSRRLRRP